MTINHKALEAKSNEELLRLEQDMVDLFPVNELKELSQMIKEILEERKNNAIMRPFTKCDWYDFAGAERFLDGNEPYVGRYDILTVVVDRNGLQAWLEDMENNVFIIEAKEAFREITIGTGNLILQIAKEKTPAELIAIFSNIH